MTLLVTLMAPSASALAQALTSGELQTELSGSTLSGYNTSGVVFSEYHAPDGRIFGHNNGEAVVEGCWEVRSGGVCYYYARNRYPGSFCWRYERAGPEGYRIRSLETDARGIARREAGNPRAHSDGGRPWTCEGLVSGLDRGAPAVAQAAGNLSAKLMKHNPSGLSYAFDGRRVR